MARFYLVRHGEFTYKPVEERNFIGHGLELAPLTEDGIRQAVECSKDKRLAGCDLIITSTYTRALQTAAILSKNLGIDIRVEIDLREHELDLSYQVKSHEDLKRIASEEQKNNGLLPENGSFRWELRTDVKTRALNVLARYTTYKKVIVVTHGMVIHCLTGAVGIPHCSVHEFDMD